MKRKNLVYVLGAGASKDFGLPLGNEIYDYAYNILSLKREPIYKELKLVIRQVEKNLNCIFINLPHDKKAYPPFEEVLTFIWDSKKDERFDYKTNKLVSLFDTEYGAKEVLTSFVRMLGLTIAGSMLYFLPSKDINIFSTYIKNLDFRENNISFISLNYDLILDNILSECVADKIINDYTYGVSLADAFRKISYPNSDRIHIRDNGIPLLKPHGSLNLVHCSSHKQATYGFGYFYLKDNYNVIFSNGIKCPSCGRETKPLIIPPLYNKQDYIENTKPASPRLFRSTPDYYRRSIDYIIQEILQKADEIIVIGYSMPPYDYDFRTLFIKNLMSNKKRKHVHLKIITKVTNKYNKYQLEVLKTQCKYLVGKVTIECCDGFYNYLKAIV